MLPNVVRAEQRGTPPLTLLRYAKEDNEQVRSAHFNPSPPTSPDRHFPNSVECQLSLLPYRLPLTLKTLLTISS